MKPGAWKSPVCDDVFFWKHTSINATAFAFYSHFLFSFLSLQSRASLDSQSSFSSPFSLLSSFSYLLFLQRRAELCSPFSLFIAELPSTPNLPSVLPSPSSLLSPPFSFFREGQSFVTKLPPVFNPSFILVMAL